MTAISPKLKVGLGLAAAAAVFSFVRGSGGDEPLLGETFESPLALIVENDAPVTNWEAPPVTRNPFASGSLTVDAVAVADLATEPTPPSETVDDGATADNAAGGVTNSTSRTVVTTESTLSLEETISRRLPPGAPAGTTVPPTSDAPANPQTPTTSDGTIQIDG